MRRLVIAYSPKSSKHLLMEQEVLAPARKLPGYMICKFEVLHVPVEENAKRLCAILRDGDLLLAVGGDGTATMALNAAMQFSGRVTLAVLGYGNFNDMARTLGKKRSFSSIISDFEQGKVRKMYPLEAYIDGVLYRYAACYFTVGMFAESTEIFDQPATRGKLKKGHKGLLYSVMRLASWYFKNKRREFLPKELHASDVLFVNGKTVAKVMKGGEYWQKSAKFLVYSGKLTSFFRLAGFMMRSMFKRIPGREILREKTLRFSNPTEVEIQAEGEYQRILMQELKVKKSARSIDVV